MADAAALRPGGPRRWVVALPDPLELARANGRTAAQLYRDVRAGAGSGWDFGSRWLADGRTLTSIYTTRYADARAGCDDHDDPGVALGRVHVGQPGSGRADSDFAAWPGLVAQTFSGDYQQFEVPTQCPP
jgi:hypothetical protein